MSRFIDFFEQAVRGTGTRTDLDEQQAEIAKQQELLDHDREIRELRALATIDAVFLAVEPNDRSYHPSGKQVLLA
jgi:hypothetical protein